MITIQRNGKIVRPLIFGLIISNLSHKNRVIDVRVAIVEIDTCP
jgi:hypothetical protein